jgi:hypothetical protein
MLVNPYAYEVVGGGGDPYWANVSLLLDCDAASPWTDKSSFAHNLGTYEAGPPTLDTTHQPFGTGCLEMASSSGGTGVNGMLGCNVATGSSLDLSAGDWTIEGWFYLRGTAASVLFSTTYQNHIYCGTTATNISAVIEGGSMNNPTFSRNTWHHMAFVMHSNSFQMYLDGVAPGAANAITRTTWAAEEFYICGTQYGASMAGLIKEIRVTKGVARYLSNFTPATAEFPTHA